MAQKYGDVLKDSGQFGDILDHFNKSNDVGIAESFFTMLLIIGICIKLLGNIGLTVIGQATSTIWGYTVVLFALLGIIILQFDTTEVDFFKQIKTIPNYMFWLVVLIIWVLSLNIKYYEVINKQKVPPEFNMWNNWSTWSLLIITITIPFTFMLKKTNYYVNTKSSYLLKNSEQDLITIIYFILLIVFIIIGIQNIILQNFSVDG
jgi:hypothetical protein